MNPLHIPVSPARPDGTIHMLPDDFAVLVIGDEPDLLVNLLTGDAQHVTRSAFGDYFDARTGKLAYRL